MDKTVPAPAARLLDFIGMTEAPQGYTTIYGNNQSKLPKQITSMTLAQIIAAQGGWSKKFGSSATGRYQFMKATLVGLKEELGLSGNELFSADFQDRLGFHLLKRRGYEAFIAGKIDRTEFGKRLAMEWASFPVLTVCTGAHRQLQRGQSYYAGDGLNKALVKPEKVEAVLNEVRAAKPIVVPPNHIPDAGNMVQKPVIPGAPEPVQKPVVTVPPAKKHWLVALIEAIKALFGRK